MKQIIKLLLLILISTQLSQAQTRLDDSLALVDLYNANPNSNLDWDFTQLMDSLEGVTITYPIGRVQRLELVNLKIDSLPDLNLTGLLRLNLSNNELKEIPKFTKILNLSFLNLLGNQLTSFPDSINLSNLINLSLTNNELTSVPYFVNFSELTWLDLSYNQLTSVPDFSSLPNIQWIDLEYNQLVSVPDFTNLSNLLMLYLRGNQLETIPDFTNFPKLEFLDLRSNQLCSIPNFTNLNLRDLNIADNQIKETIPKFIISSKLAFFNLNNNSITFENLIDSRQFNEDLCASNSGGYYYSFQDSVSTSDTISIPINTNYTIDLQIDDTVTTNTYVWFKDGITYDTTIVNKLHFQNIQTADGGVYTCEITNPHASALTLYSHPKTVEVITCEVQANEELHGPTNIICPDNRDPYRVYEPVNGIPYFNRYIFYKNGEIIQDSTSNEFKPNYNLVNGDSLTAIAIDSNNCYYSVKYTRIRNAYENPEITLCAISSDSVLIQLTNGSPPYDFDLSVYDDLGNYNVFNYTVYSNDTILEQPQNTDFEVENVKLVNDHCNPNPTTYKAAYIDGCTAVCVGHMPNYSELYHANFPTLATNIQWTIAPVSAITNGSVTVIGGQNTKFLEIDFSNTTPVDSVITIQVSANTDCGTETLTKVILLDQNCVWPGDINNDGQVSNDPDKNWISDVIALNFALEDYNGYLNNPNNTLQPTLRPMCLAEKSWDWKPQSASDWTLNDTLPAVFDILDSNNNVINVLNLKYADCNNDGIIEYDDHWNPNVPFEDVQDPTDYDIVIYHALQQKTHDGNSSNSFNPSYAENFHIETEETVYNNGDEVVFKIRLGSPQNPVNDVSQLVFVGAGSFGTYRQPTIRIVNSHLTKDYNDLIDYPFILDDSNGNPDSLRWHISMNTDTGSVDFRGEVVCEVICIVTPLEFQNGNPSNNFNPLTDSIPVTFKLSLGGIGIAGDTALFGVSNETNIWVRPCPILDISVLLKGPYDKNTGLMDDDLRRDQLLPLVEPYHLDSLFHHTQMVGIQIDSAVRDSTWVNSIVGLGICGVT